MMNINFLSKKNVQYIVLAVVTFGVYANTLWNGFVYDDADLILRNTWIRDFSHLREIFSSSIGTFLNGYQTGTYRPGVHVVNMVQYAIFGLKPWGFHLINILFYVLTVLMVHMTASRLFKSERSTFFPLIASGYFAVHTGHSEVVSWVSAQAEIFFTFFFLAALCLHVSERPSLLKSALAGLSFFVALLFKETALALLPILILRYFSMPEASGRGRIRSYLPLAMAVFSYFLIRYFVIIVSLPGQNVYDLTVFQYVINIVYMSGFYFFKLLLPVHLAAYYYIQPIYSVAETRAIISLLFAAGLLALTFYFFRREKNFFFALGWVIFAMLPTLYLPGLGKSMFADRYLFLPSIGFAFIVGLLVIKVSRTGLPGQARKFAFILFSLYIILLAFGTIKRNLVWQESLTLWQDATVKYPTAPIPHYNLGLAYADKGEMDKAIREFELAVNYDGDYVDARYNLGFLYSRKGMIDEAMIEFAETIRLSPGSADAHYQLGLLFRSKGLINEAAEEFKIAGEQNPALKQDFLY